MVDRVASDADAAPDGEEEDTEGAHGLGEEGAVRFTMHAV